MPTHLRWLIWCIYMLYTQQKSWLRCVGVILHLRQNFLRHKPKFDLSNWTGNYFFTKMANFVGSILFFRSNLSADYEKHILKLSLWRIFSKYTKLRKYLYFHSTQVTRQIKRRQLLVKFRKLVHLHSKTVPI